MSKTISAVILGMLLSTGCMGLSKAYAHCDTLDGPVVQDAKTALEKGDVTPALKWVKKDAEPEIQSAFQTALTDRKVNKEPADLQFFETLVRVHRAGEGAGFTGLKPAGSVEPAIAEADKALESGAVDPLTTKMAHRITEGVKERFAQALQLKKHKDETVEAGRAYVEAYVEYVHYVEGIHNAAAGASANHAEEAGEPKEIVGAHHH